MKDRHSRSLRDLCAQIHDDDRADRKTGRSADEFKTDRKTLQLCKQARRTIEASLAQSRWAIDAHVVVHEVIPAPDSSTLQITLMTTTPDLVRPHATRALPALRAAVAHAISRKRAPALTVIVITPTTHSEGNT